MGESYDIATREILKLGFNSETIQLTDTIIENMVKNFKKSKEMSGLLHKVINSKTGTQYQRSHMTSVVACEVVKNLNLNDREAYEKIAFASFFHDIMLTERDDLSKINSFEELDETQLSEADWDLVFNHANDASMLIKSHPEAPMGADEIIRHHHGAFNGKGFSSSIDKLPILSKIFIVAHHFVFELIKFKENGGDPKPVTEELYKKYPSPEVVLIIKALEKTLKKKK
jgi:response regulator RpfG family c-di-GMP phosphodiesterase